MNEQPTIHRTRNALVVHFIKPVNPFRCRASAAVFLTFCSVAALSAAEVRQRLNTGWEFYQGSLGSVWEVWRGERASDNVPWTPVTLPHCFNARDAEGLSSGGFTTSNLNVSDVDVLHDYAKY